MKICARCNVSRNSSEFYVDKRTGALRSWCKICQSHIMKQWKLDNSERASGVVREWRRNHQDGMIAHELVRRALRSGAVKREPCEVCGNKKSHGHHDDYSKPLDIRWLCSKHHAEQHRVYL